jgi:hypothetical protein
VNWRWVEEGDGYVGRLQPHGQPLGVGLPSGLQCLVPYPYRVYNLPAFSQGRYEVPIAAGTRVLIGPGGAVEGVLTSEQCVSVRINNIQEGDTKQSIREAMQRYGNVIEVSQLWYLQKLPGGGGPRWAKVSYENAAQAAQALAHSSEMEPWQLKPWKAPRDNNMFTQVSIPRHSGCCCLKLGQHYWWWRLWHNVLTVFVPCCLLLCALSP